MIFGVDEAGVFEGCQPFSGVGKRSFRGWPESAGESDPPYGRRQGPERVVKGCLGRGGEGLRTAIVAPCPAGCFRSLDSVIAAGEERLGLVGRSCRVWAFIERSDAGLLRQTEGADRRRAGRV